MKNTIFSGYIWEKYSHITPQYDDMTGMVDPLPVTSAGMLKINSNASNEVIGKFEPIKQYYLWTKLEYNATKGIITCKRKPSEITLDDIVGFYLVDSDGSIGQEYVGIENIRDKEREGWVSNVSSSDYDTLLLEWEEDGESGIDNFGFAGELTDVDIDDGSSNNLEDYCFNFSNSGTITITLTNLGNYALRDDTLYPINLYGGTGKTFGFDLYKYGSNTSISRVRVNSIGATQSTGEKTSAIVTLNVPSAGLYYVKCNIGTNIGTSSGYNFSMGTSDLANYYPCNIICDWSLHVESMETMSDNMCVSVYNYLNYWYEKSGNDPSFHPDRIDVGVFSEKMGWGSRSNVSYLDSKKRMLWDNWNSSTSKDNIEYFYPITSLTDSVPIYDDSNMDYDMNQLISVKHIVDFDIFESGFSGTIKSPAMDANCVTSLKIAGSAVGLLDSAPQLSTQHTFSKNNTTPSVENIKKMYLSEYGSIAGISRKIQLTLNVLSEDSRILSRSTSFPYKIPITFEGGSYELSSTSTESIYLGAPAKYTLNLNDQWRVELLTTESGLDGVYTSYSNYNVNNSAAIMTININGYKKFSIYIRSNGEPNYDYVMVSQLDQSITGSTAYNNATLVKAHTRGNQQSGTAITNYTLVEYDNIDGGEHTITVVYRKDTSQHSGTDKGYLIINKNGCESYNTNSGYYSTVIAEVSDVDKNLNELGKVTNIDYSNLMFITGSGGNIEQTQFELDYSEYWFGTGDGSNIIYLSDCLDTFKIISGTGKFVYRDGTEKCNITYTVTGNKIVIPLSTIVGNNLQGNEGYIVVKCRKTDSLLEAPIAFRVKFYTVGSGFEIVNANFGDCTLYFSDAFDVLCYTVCIRNNINQTIRFSPIEGLRADDVVLNTGEATSIEHRYFAHGNVTGLSSIPQTLKAVYNGADAISIAEGEQFSLIPNTCDTIGEVIDFCNTIYTDMSSSVVDIMYSYQ